MADEQHPEKLLRYNPETGAIAISTTFAESGDHADMAWLTASANGVAKHSNFSGVSTWTDTFTVVNGKVVAESED